MSAREKDDVVAIATNRRARHNYEIEQTFEAGIALVGSEVKMLRAHKASLQDAYGLVNRGEVWVYGMHIPEYPQASMQNHEPTRARKLLLHTKEINKLATKTLQQGYTLVPLRLYFKGNKVKVEIALARGRRKWDKREAIAKREATREIAKHAGAVRRGEAKGRR
ncbi:MAG: SsrA-binding protein SmpB [Actinomycetota bacterium]